MAAARVSGGAFILSLPVTIRSSAFPRRSRWLPLAAVLLLVLTGCWPISQEGGGTPSGTPSAATPASTITQLPAASGALNIALQADDPPSLDPALATDKYSLFLIRQIFSALVTFDDNMNVVPDLAALDALRFRRTATFTPFHCAAAYSFLTARK